MALHSFFKLSHCLQTHFRIADFRSKPPDIPQGVVLLPEETVADLFAHQSQSRARFLQMLAHLVYRRVVSLRFAFGNGDGPLDLLAANPAKIVAKGFSVSQFVAHS